MKKNILLLFLFSSVFYVSAAGFEPSSKDVRVCLHDGRVKSCLEDLARKTTRLPNLGSFLYFLLHADYNREKTTLLFFKDFNESLLVKFCQTDLSLCRVKEFFEEKYPEYKEKSFAELGLAHKRKILKCVFIELFTSLNKRYNFYLGDSALGPDEKRMKIITEADICKLAQFLVEGVITIKSFDTVVDEATEL